MDWCRPLVACNIYYNVLHLIGMAGVSVNYMQVGIDPMQLYSLFKMTELYCSVL